MERSVTYREKEIGRLPGWAGGGFALVQTLERRRLLDQVKERIRFRREGGYSGFDIWLFLVVYFSSELSCGLRGFWVRASAFSAELGAIAGRRCLASRSSVSRALATVRIEEVRAVAFWLLTEVADVWALLAHPAVKAYDALGNGWHVFHGDGTVTTLRRRGLPEGEDLPAARRRSESMAAPGYSGRKRGEVQVRRDAVQHAGSGVWLGGWLSPGNGRRREMLPRMLAAVRRCCERLGHPPGRALLVLDGEYGSVPDYTDMREASVPFITRFNRLRLLDQPDVQQRMAEATWEFVPDSGSGPMRSATDLGVVTVPPGDGTVRPDGSSYDPVVVRVVASRRLQDGEADHGRVINDWQYELFAVDLDPDCWPAAEAVAAFYGRAGQENRFAQEDRELGLDRIKSFKLPGQEFASIVALMVWNHRIARGFELAMPPNERPAPRPRDIKVDDRPVPLPAAALDEPGDSSSSPEIRSEPMDPVEVLADAEGKVLSALDSLDWPKLLTGRPGWSWSAVEGGLLCPDSKSLRLSSIATNRWGKNRVDLLFNHRPGTCDSCDHKPVCFSTDKPRASKLLGVTVDREQVEDAAAILQETQPLRRPQSARRRHHIRQQRRAASSPTHPPAMACAPFVASPEPGPCGVATSLFLPARARQLHARALLDLDLYVQVDRPPEPLPHPVLLARSNADRQHRRRTWEEHLDRYALPPDTHVHIAVAGGAALTSLLHADPSDEQSVA